MEEACIDKVQEKEGKKERKKPPNKGEDVMMAMEGVVTSLFDNIFWFSFAFFLLFF